MAFTDQRAAIIAGLTSAQSETHGWNNEVKAKIAVTDVVRTSDTVVTITLDAESGYLTTANETITVTIPGAALTGGNPIVATPTFVVAYASTYVPTSADAGVVADASAYSLPVAATESGTVADSALSRLTVEPNATDTGIVADVAASAFTGPGYASDAGIVADVAADVIAFDKLAADAGVVADASTASGEYTVTDPVETATISEETFVDDILGKDSGPDAAVAADVATVALRAAPAATETAIVADAATCLIVMAVLAVGTATMADSSSVGPTYEQVASDLAVLSDSAICALANAEAVDGGIVSDVAAVRVDWLSLAADAAVGAAAAIVSVYVPTPAGVAGAVRVPSIANTTGF